MKKFLLLVIFLSCLIFAKQIAYVFGLDPNGDNFLAVRDAPKGKQIGSLYNNDKIEILKKNGLWYKIHNESGLTGWVYYRYLNVANRRHNTNRSLKEDTQSGYKDFFTLLDTPYKIKADFGIDYNLNFDANNDIFITGGLTDELGVYSINTFKKLTTFDLNSLGDFGDSNLRAGVQNHTIIFSNGYEIDRNTGDLPPNFGPDPKLVYNNPTNGGYDHEKAIYGGADRCDLAGGAACPDPKRGDSQIQYQ